MSAPFGVVATGFSTKTLEEIRTDLEARARTQFGAQVDLDPETSVLGKLIGILSDRLADAWQLGQGLYAAAFPDSASGVPLVQGVSLTGVVAVAPSPTRVNLLVTGTPGTLLAPGRLVSIPDVALAQFSNAAVIAIPLGGSITAEFVCTSNGPVAALAGLVTQIDTPVTGWASVTNAADQTYLGTDAESDSALKIRREATIRTIGGAAFEAIRAHVLEVDGVTDCYVFENETDATVDTIPAHAFETVVRGGTEADIKGAIFATKPTAIRAYGTTTANVTDSQGTTHGIGYTRPAALNIYVTLDIQTNANAPTNIDDLIKAEVAALGDRIYRTGSPVVAQALVATVFGVTDEARAAGIAGVVDVAAPKIGTAATPTLSTTITPTKRQIADLDTSRIVVNITRV